jgi:Ca-activated chloride channel family protein
MISPRSTRPPLRSHAFRVFGGALSLGLLACAPKGSPVVVKPEPEPVQPVIVQGDWPAFTFEVEGHVTRSYAPVPAPPAFSTLPPLKTSSKCWDPTRGAPVDDVARFKKTPPKDPVKPTPIARKDDPNYKPYDATGKTNTTSGEGQAIGGATPSTAGAGGDRERSEAPIDYAPPSGTESLADADVSVAKNDRRPTRDEREPKGRKRGEGRRPSPDAPAPAQEPSSSPLSYDDANIDGRVEPDPTIVEYPPLPPAYEGWGGSTFLSNDDSMSLSSAQRVIFAIERGLALPFDHVRPHEFLNYFSFPAPEPAPGWDFAVTAEIGAALRDSNEVQRPDGGSAVGPVAGPVASEVAGAPLPTEEFGLALTVRSRPLDRESRRNVALTLVVDRSGSMKQDDRIRLVKRGLSRMLGELKAGDVVNLVTFDDKLCAPVTSFVVGRDDTNVLVKAIAAITPRGKTNLDAALDHGYALADASYLDAYTNRVLLVTDALANVGETSPWALSRVTDGYDARRVRLSGIGVGADFSDHLLDRLTEAGRGAYVFLGSEAETDAVFGDRFVSLVETIGNDVHYQLRLPPTLRLRRFHGEQASSVREEVQAVHVFADTKQTFLADVEAWNGELRPQDQIALDIEYEHAETGALLKESFVFTLGDILAQGTSRSVTLRKAQAVITWGEGLAALAGLGWPVPGDPIHPSRQRGQAVCADVDQRLARAESDLRDRELTRIRQLWQRRCAAYGETRRPTRRTSDDGSWPSAR